MGLSGYFVFYFMFSSNGKDLVTPVCGEYCPLHTFLDLPREVFMLTTYLAFWEWVWVEKAGFIIIAQTWCEWN